jgi:hypothetical protein
LDRVVAELHEFVATTPQIDTNHAATLTAPLERSLPVTAAPHTPPTSDPSHRDGWGGGGGRADAPSRAQTGAHAQVRSAPQPQQASSPRTPSPRMRGGAVSRDTLRALSGMLRGSSADRSRLRALLRHIAQVSAGRQAAAVATSPHQPRIRGVDAVSPPGDGASRVGRVRGRP